MVNNKKDKNDLVILNILVPKSLRTEFKIYCARNDITMRDKLRLMIQEEIHKEQNPLNDILEETKND